MVNYQNMPGYHIYINDIITKNRYILK